MVQESRRVIEYLKRLLSGHDLSSLREKLAPKNDTPAPKFPGGTRIDDHSLDRRWKYLQTNEHCRELLADSNTLSSISVYKNNIENFIGTVKVPVGIVGALRVNGVYANGDYHIPLATTEAALVASYSRGAQLISAAGGCTAMLLSEGVSRSPGFAFSTAAEAGEFAVWAFSQVDPFKQIAESTTQHGQFVDLRVAFEGNHVYLILEMTTGDASGQNMVTLAAEAICEYIHSHTPVRPAYSFVEANLSGDKKASFQSFTTVRGKKVTAEVDLPAQLVERYLHTSPRSMVDYWRMSVMGGVLSGCIGVQGHVANGLAALFIATGQDVACVAEAAVGVTRFELREDGALYATVTLPNMIVGTVGGGTHLPTQQACLQLMGLAGEGQAQAFAEVCGAVALAGELSIIGAISAQQFARAHRRLARNRK